MLNINSTTIAKCQIIFIPVIVNRGRKFRGPAFDLGGSYTSRFGYACSGVCPLQITEKERLWDPASKRMIYINADYLEERKISDAELNDAIIQYITDTIQSTINWCKSVKPNLSDVELQRFIRNCLKKQHPEMLPVIDEVYPDNRDVVTAVQKTLEWAINLKTRPCVIYGRVCKGGRPYGKTETVRKAWNVLDRKGYTKLDGFKEAWLFMTNMLELPDYGVKL